MGPRVNFSAKGLRDTDCPEDGRFFAALLNDTLRDNHCQGVDGLLNGGHFDKLNDHALFGSSDVIGPLTGGP